MAVKRHHAFIRDEILPSWWANAIQVPLSALAPNFHVRRLNATTLRVPAGAGSAVAAISIEGLWRWSEANVDVSHPGGAAGLYRVFATAVENDIVSTPDPNTDLTDYSFGLSIRPDGSTPNIVAGVVDVFTEVATVQWDGSAITAIAQSRNSVAAAQLEDELVSGSGAVVATRQPGGGFLLSLAADSIGATELAPGAVTNTEVNASAAIAESKLALASDAVAGTPSRRTLGTGAQQALPGNHSSTTDARTPTAHAASHVRGGSDAVLKGQNRERPFSFYPKTVAWPATGEILGTWKVRLAPNEEAYIDWLDGICDSGSGAAVKVQEFASGSWSDLSGVALTGVDTDGEQLDVSDVALVSGRWYRVVSTAAGTSKGGAFVLHERRTS